MTDKPRVEPSVSEPAPQAPCKHCYGHGQIMISAGDAEWWEKCGYCKPEPVIAPQPTPEPHDDKWAREAAEQEDGANVCTGTPQGVGKLSPEPANDCDLLESPYSVISEEDAWVPDSSPPICEEVDGEIRYTKQGATVANRELTVGPDSEKRAKEVEGVGQTAREHESEVKRYADWPASAEYWFSEAKQLREAYGQLERETLTLMAELQIAANLLFLLDDEVKRLGCHAVEAAAKVTAAAKLEAR